MEGLNPKIRRKFGLKEEGPNNIVRGANHSFCAPVLRRSIWAREAERDSMSGEIFTEGGVEELASVVTMQTANSGAKLGRYKREETKQGITCVRLGTQRKHPRVMRVIIQNIEIKFVTRTANNWRGPEVKIGRAHV